MKSHSRAQTRSGSKLHVLHPNKRPILATIPGAIMHTDSNFIHATVTEAAPGGAMLSGHRWRIRGEDGRLLWAVITAKVHTLQIPTLQVGDQVVVRLHASDPTTCSVDLAKSPVQWVGPSKLERMKSVRANSPSQEPARDEHAKDDS